MSLGLILCVIGFLTGAVGGLWLFVLAFAESILWGMGTMLLWPAATVAFSVVHWPRTRIPTLLHFLGLVILIAGGVLWFLQTMDPNRF